MNGLRSSPKPRRGAALVAALALLALSAALVSGSFAAARALSLRTRAESARLLAESSAMRAVVLLVASWDSADDALPPGGSLYRDLVSILPASDAGAPAVTGRARVTRLSDREYVVTVDVRVGASPLLARRRLQLLLLRHVPDSASVARGDPPSAPRPIGTWNLADLY